MGGVHRQSRLYYPTLYYYPLYCFIDLVTKEKKTKLEDSDDLNSVKYMVIFVPFWTAQDVLRKSSAWFNDDVTIIVSKFQQKKIKFLFTWQCREYYYFDKVLYNSLFSLSSEQCSEP